MAAECPVCVNEIDFEDDTIVGELLACPFCGTELEVINLDPPTLEVAPELDEDWGQ